MKRTPCSRRLAFAAAALLFGAVLAARAQESPSFKQSEHALNGGGRPQQGASAASASFRITLDSIGDAAARASLASGSFRMDGGFVVGYPPPGEVGGLVFRDDSTLVWDAEQSAGSYALYRDAVSTLPGSFGTCCRSDLSAPTGVDAASPPGGVAWFYLATVRNRLREEGTKGSTSAGTERANPAPCP